jgi:hypothetical protein
MRAGRDVAAILGARNETKRARLSGHRLQPPLYLPYCLEKLSEKEYELRTEREFKPYTEPKMSRKVPFRWPVRLHHRPLRTFSDSFKAKFAEHLF